MSSAPMGKREGIAVKHWGGYWEEGTGKIVIRC